MPEHWDKSLTGKLIELGLSWEQARAIVGLVADMRESAYCDGYAKAFNDVAYSERAKVNDK